MSGGAASAFYTVYLCDQYGVRLADASDFVSLKYARVTNAPSWLEIELPLSVNLNNIVIPDGRIEVWRAINDRASVLETECSWLIQAIEQRIDDQGKKTIVVYAVHPLWSLAQPGRYVLSFRGSTDAKATQAADDLIKAVVRQCTVAATDTNRVLPFGVASNTTQAPVISKSFPYRPALEVIQEIAQDVTQDGTYLAFDIVNTGSIEYEFRTYINQRGIDRRFPNGVVPLLIGPEYGNVGQLKVRRDWSKEVTAVTVLGPGQGSKRATTLRVDSSRSVRSPWRYREALVDNSAADTVAERNAEGRSALRAGRPVVSVEGRLLSTQNSLYGRDWNWGDYLSLQSGFGFTIDSRVDAIQVQVTRERETIDAVLRGEQFL